MKKWIVFILAALMLLSMAACGSNSGETEAPLKAATPAEIEAAVAAALGDGCLATVDVPEEELFTSPLGDLDLSRVKSYVAKQSEVVSVDVDTIVIAECEDGYADEAVAKLNEAYGRILSYIRQYPFGYIFGTYGGDGQTAVEQYYYGSSTSSTTRPRSDAAAALSPLAALTPFCSKSCPTEPSISSTASCPPPSFPS